MDLSRKYYLVFFFLFASVQVVLSDELTQFPLGGHFFINKDNWNLEELKLLSESKQMLLISKNNEDLQGFIFGGTVDFNSRCEAKKKSESWENCLIEGEKKEGVANYQIILERKIQDEVYQQYTISFNINADDKESLTIIKQLQQEMIR